ncbi:hypothetical protein PFISCL1PPCAC_2324, partial [Pristionchus fissidentatus]
ATMFSEDLMETKGRSIWLKCSDCGIVKSGMEDMEIHMKTEHLNWLPFKCPHCGTLRALSSQMREHLHSSHRAHQSILHYVDDATATRRLREMMDETVCTSLMGERNSTKKEEETAKGTTTASSGEIIDLPNGSVKTFDLPPTPAASPESVNGMMMGVRKRTKTDTERSNESHPSSSQSTVPPAGSSSIEAVLVKKVKVEEPEEENEERQENADPLSFLSGLGPIVHDSDMVGEVEGEGEGGMGEIIEKLKIKKVRSVSLRNCSQCHKAIKSSEKGMHVYLHLSKDHQIHRFRCLVPDCSMEGYRKVSIVHHQQKKHGVVGVDNALILDRQHELTQLCQAMDDRLFGSSTEIEGGFNESAGPSNLDATIRDVLEGVMQSM